MTSALRHVLSAVAGITVAGFVVLGAASLGGDEPGRRPPPEAQPPEPVRLTSEPEPSDHGLLLAWVPTGTGGLPNNATSLLKQTKGVEAVTISAASLDWMTSSSSSGGQVDVPPDGMRIPVEVVAIEPGAYSRFVPPSDRDAIAGLERGEVLLSRTSAALRSYAAEMTVSLESGDYEVAGVISDTAANGYEMVVAGPPRTTWQIIDRFALLLTNTSSARGRVTRVLQNELEPGQVLRTRAKGETPYLRYGDAVMPQSIIKESFGEFAARPRGDGTVVIDPRWTERNIVRESVPVLGDIVCHKALFPQLEQALGEVRRRGLSFLIDTSQFGGCYGPRFIGRVAGGRLSHHAWGIAIDINAADNAFGTRSDLDPRLVEIMERFGFTWGGRWLIPDGMHFEWVRFP